MFWDFENCNCRFCYYKTSDSKDIFSKLVPVFHKNGKTIKFDESIWVFFSWKIRQISFDFSLNMQFSSKRYYFHIIMMENLKRRRFFGKFYAPLSPHNWSFLEEFWNNFSPPFFSRFEHLEKRNFCFFFHIIFFVRL